MIHSRIPEIEPPPLTRSRVAMRVGTNLSRADVPSSLNSKYLRLFLHNLGQTRSLDGMYFNFIGRRLSGLVPIRTAYCADQASVDSPANSRR
jgi:hypothetical protein